MIGNVLMLTLLSVNMMRHFHLFWINMHHQNDILVLKALRRKYESLWRKTRLTVHFDMYSESSMAVKKAISKSKSVILQKKISDCNGDQKKLFKIKKLRYLIMIHHLPWPPLWTLFSLIKLTIFELSFHY